MWEKLNRKYSEPIDLFLFQFTIIRYIHFA